MKTTVLLSYTSIAHSPSPSLSPSLSRVRGSDAREALKDDTIIIYR